MSVSSIMCRLNRHEPVRESAEWDGSHYVGTCRHCGQVIRRKKHQQWRADWLK